MDRPIIVALDYPSAAEAEALVERLDPKRCRLKVGKELFTRAGPTLVERLAGRGFDIFLDLKYHDIPNTVARACEAAADLGVWMVNVHCLGGPRMLAAASEVLAARDRRPLLIGVTILTSMGGEELAAVGLAGTPEENVRRLAALARNSGLDGVVCSAREAGVLRTDLGSKFKLITPGIRPSWAAKGDQTRITTPADAVRDGASYLVIGRPITGAADPLEAIERIEQELVGAGAA